MPQLIVTIRYQSPPDIDGDTYPVTKNIDILPELTDTQRTTVASIMTRIYTVVSSRYKGVVEGIRYIPE